jgi:hypothetical protein
VEVYNPEQPDVACTNVRAEVQIPSAGLAVEQNGGVGQYIRWQGGDVYSSASRSIVEVIWVRRRGLVSTARRGMRRGHCRRSGVVGLVQQHRTYVYSSEGGVYRKWEARVSENVNKTYLDFGVVRRNSITHKSMRSP